MATKRLDHGILNIPLAKRGNIDREIDNYKAAQAVEARAKAAARRETMLSEKARLTELLGMLSDDRVLKLAAPLGKIKPSTARAELARVASGNRAAFIRSFERELAASAQVSA